jgi:pimeloyl-ACP methyl ester carboxylesterase
MVGVVRNEIDFEEAQVTSKDGTTIGYRKAGTGPGLVLLHGGGQSSKNFTTLGRLLADSFTVYIPDRRGRGLSGPQSESHGMTQEIEDLAAVVSASGAEMIFGLSIGALVVLEAALVIPGLRKIAVYEPPLEFPGVSQTDWVPRFEREREKGDLAAALVTILKGTGDRSASRLVPRWLFTLAIRGAMKRGTGPNPHPEAAQLRAIVPTMHYDARTVADAKGSPARFTDLRCEVLLLGGAKSHRSLVAAMDALAAAVPSSRRVTLAGVGHTAADNRGKPVLVADELRQFFSS